FVVIYSDNDPYVSVKYSEIFKEKLGAKLIFKPGAKHFSGSAVYEENCTALPEVSQSILIQPKQHPYILENVGV
ncbi:MAG: hypothetical protein AAB731_04025, partial [Patescibacteria group bacterium]